MHLLKLLAPLALALAISAPAYAKEDASHFLITPAFMQKMKAAQADLGKYKNDEDEDKSAGDKDQSLEGIIKKIDSDPRLKNGLAKHGISSREFAHATYAMLHAGMFVGTEKLMEKKKAEALFNSYTKEQQANIVLMRTMQPSK